MASERLSNLDEVFVRSISNSISDSSHLNFTKDRKIRFTGLESVTERSREIFDTVIKKHSPGRELTWIWGGIGTAIFWGLGASPAYAVYREFMEAWTGMFAKQAVRWQAFPTPSRSMICSTLLIMLLPVILCALITIAKSAPSEKISSAVEDTKRSHEKLLDELTQQKEVRLISSDPVREAVRVLLDFIHQEA
jgi:hypothetical protein